MSSCPIWMDSCHEKTAKILLNRLNLRFSYALSWANNSWHIFNLLNRFKHPAFTKAVSNVSDLDCVKKIYRYFGPAFSTFVMWSPLFPVLHLQVRQFQRSFYLIVFGAHNKNLCRRPYVVSMNIDLLILIFTWRSSIVCNIVQFEQKHRCIRLYRFIGSLEKGY